MCLSISGVVSGDRLVSALADRLRPIVPHACVVEGRNGNLVGWPGPWPDQLLRPEVSDDGEQLRVWFQGKPGEVVALEAITWAEIAEE